MTSLRVCEACARRTWLLARLAGHLDAVRGRIGDLLELDDPALIEAVGGGERDLLHDELEAVDGAAEADRRARARLEAICRCDPDYPDALRELAAPPAVLHVAGSLARLLELVAERSVAVVGARRPSPYGREVARGLAGGLAGADIAVVSGLALGIDAAAHEGALDSGGATVAVLAGGADRPYPASHHRLHGRVREHGAVVSELGSGVAARRWMFPARNRVIAALAGMTVVVQAREGSGALITAGWAGALGRPLGAVPGQVSAPLSVGPHRLLRDGASLITGAGDVLDELYGEGAWAPRERRGDALDAPLQALLGALADGETGSAAFTRAGLDADGGLAALAALELSGQLRRGAGGRWSVRAV